MISGSVITIPPGGSLSIEDVATFFNVAKRSDNKYHLKDVVTATGINEWARMKPVRSSRTGNMRQSYDSSLTNYDANNDDYADANFGFNVNSLIAYSVEGAFSLAQINGGKWTYDKPRGVTANYTEWLRLRDLNGYDGAAPAPYDFDAYGNSQAKTITITVWSNEFEGAQIGLDELSGVPINSQSPTTTTTANYRLGFAYKSGNVVVSHILNKTLANSFEIIDGEQGYESYSFASVPNGTYQVIAFITNKPANPDPEESYQYIYIPGGYDTVTISNAQPITGLDVYVDELFVTPTVNIDGTLSAISIDGLMNTDTGNEIDYTFTVDLYEYDTTEQAIVLLDSQSASGSLVSTPEDADVVFTNLTKHPSQYYVEIYYEFDYDTYYIDPIDASIPSPNAPVRRRLDFVIDAWAEEE